MSNIVPYQELTHMADAMAKSQLFGMKTPDQVIALMLVAQANNQHPAAAARDYDIIQGRPAKKAEAMLRDFIQAGGSVQWHALSNDIADATFSHPQGGSVRIDWSLKRAAEAGLSGKDMYRKFPRQMLRSRCVSEGVRTVFPVATGGLYAPEEVQDMPTAQVVQLQPSAPVQPLVEVPDERYEAIKFHFESATNMEDVADVWKGLSKNERKASSHLKDEAKQRLSEDASPSEDAA